MRMTKGTFAFVGALLLVPALAMAAGQTGTARTADAPKAKAAVTAATHATKGIVKSVDDASLVITKGAKAAKTQTFVLNATTVKKGDLAAGARVEVRYRAEGGQNVATAVTASVPKGKSNSLPKSSK